MVILLFLPSSCLHSWEPSPWDTAEFCWGISKLIKSSLLLGECLGASPSVASSAVLMLSPVRVAVLGVLSCCHAKELLSSTAHLHQGLQASLQRRLLCFSFFSGVKLLLKGCTLRRRDEGVIICSLQQLARIREDQGGNHKAEKKARRDSGTVRALSPGVMMKTLWACSSQEGGSDLPAPSG